ncbi:cation:proton antiporter [Candidatus Woesearchaeota archaeon]|nr:cation:proton antiporter [Candidatus Woesearchaeota archaeon]
MDLFTEISLAIILVIIVSFLIRLLKQPLIISYILAGIVAGPLLLKLVVSNDTFATLSKVGIALLLFIVGLGMNPKLIKEVGFISLIAGLGQVIATAIAGFVILHFALGYAITPSIYLAAALTFSSTIIVVKLLSDKNLLETLYGRITIGILLVQDLIAIIALMIISATSSGIANSSGPAGYLLLKGVVVLLVLVAAGYYLLPRLSKYVAQSQEFLLVFSLGWCFAIATLFNYLGFSLEIGALLAGVTLSMTPYHHEISSKVKPIRDFFLVLFFILLGSQIEFANTKANLIPIIIISLFVLIIKPLIVMSIIGIMGYTKRNGFITGLNLAQVSEFSFILVAMGISVGHIDKPLITFITLVGLVSITGSSYYILYAEKMYNALSRFLKLFERKGKKIDEYREHGNKEYELILFGHNRIGFDVLEAIKKLKKRCLVVDFNPNTIIELTKEGVPCVYGDAGDVELFNQLNLKKVKMVISTIPDPDTNLLLINHLKQINKSIIIVAIAHQIDDALKFYEEGAGYVLMPHFVGGNHISSLLERYSFDMKKFLNEKIKHMDYLKHRKRLGHEHPRAEKFR